MRIKITEDQAKRLKLINEDVTPLTQFESLCKVKISHINNLYASVISLSIYDVFSDNQELDRVSDTISKIKNDIEIGNKEAYDYINNLPEADLDLRIDEAKDRVDAKLSSLDMILLYLDQLKESNVKFKLSQDFTDVKPLGI